MTKEELIEIFEMFLNETGNWTNFEEWLMFTLNYTPVEIGFDKY